MGTHWAWAEHGMGRLGTGRLGSGEGHDTSRLGTGRLGMGGHGHGLNTGELGMVELCSNVTSTSKLGTGMNTGMGLGTNMSRLGMNWA